MAQLLGATEADPIRLSNFNVVIKSIAKAVNSVNPRPRCVRYDCYNHDQCPLSTT